jgi:hypothetical protein
MSNYNWIYYARVIFQLVEDVIKIANLDQFLLE